MDTHLIVRDAATGDEVQKLYTFRANSKKFEYTLHARGSPSTLDIIGLHGDTRQVLCSTTSATLGKASVADPNNFKKLTDGNDLCNVLQWRPENGGTTVKLQILIGNKNATTWKKSYDAYIFKLGTQESDKLQVANYSYKGKKSVASSSNAPETQTGPVTQYIEQVGMFTGDH
jgi:hypothetical protein